MQEKKPSRHDVWIDAACLHVKKGGLIFKIKKGEEMVGTLKVSDTRIWWMPNNKKENKGMTWAEFNERICGKEGK